MSDFILEIKNVRKQYAKHLALADVSMSIPKGCIYGLLGPNGAGKTTLIRIINQIISRDTGEILFDGASLSPLHIQQVGYLPEERGLYKKMKVAEQLMYLAQLKGLGTKEAKSRIKYWFQKFDISSWWDKSIEDLSKGMQQKIQFIATVLHEPKLIILDEPFSGFDPVNANLIKDEILELKEKGATILFSTHRMESVEELCEYITLIHKSNKVLDGKANDIKHQFKQNTFEIEFEGSLSNLQGQLEVVEGKTLPSGLEYANIKVAENLSPNEVIGMLLPHVQVHRFQEKIPSINEIFIQIVTAKEPQNSELVS